MDSPREPRTSETTLGDLLARTLPQLRCFVRRRLGARLAARESVSDVVQSACREVLVDLDGDAISSESLRRNLTVAARRKLADLGRRHDAERRSIDHEVRLDARADPPSGVLRPDDQAVLREDVDRVERAIATLPPDDRDVIVLAVVLGLPHAEIARHLGTTDLATRSRLSRALARLALRM